MKTAQLAKKKKMRLRNELADILRRPDTEISLDRAVFLLAVEEYPDLDIDAQVHRLDDLAKQVAERVEKTSGGFEPLEVLNHFLYQEQGFVGDREDYRDPRNCYLNQVLDRRMGIPITLAVLHMEVGRRVGVPLEGVNFPGHFLLRHAVHRQVLLDPYGGGRFLTPLECAELLERMTDGQIPYSEDLLTSATRVQILERLLNNLRSIYMARGDVARALATLERLLLFRPEDHALRRDLGLLLLQYGEMVAGIEEIERYLEESPEPPDRQKLEELLDQAKKNILPIQ